MDPRKLKYLLKKLAPAPGDDGAGSAPPDGATGGTGDTPAAQTPPVDAPPVDTPPVDAPPSNDAPPNSLADGIDTDTPPADDTSADDDPAPVIPETPDGYDFTLPDDSGLKTEAGDPFQFDPDDPLIAEVRAIAHADGMSQEALSKMMGVFTKSQVDGNNAAQEALKVATEAKVKTELEALTRTGADGKEITGETRVKSLLTALETAGGKEMKEALIPAFTSASIVKAVEKLVGLASEGKIGDAKGNTSSDLDGLTGEALLMKIRSNQN